MSSTRSRYYEIQRNARKAYGEDEKGRAHAQRLVNMCATDSLRAVAWCHDLVEDDYASFEELPTWGVTAEELAAIILLTRFKTETYEGYIDNILEAWDMGEAGVLARTVKYYDLVDHLHPSMTAEHWHKIPRYRDALLKFIERTAPDAAIKVLEQRQDNRSSS